jgi:hypothetical protein
VIRQMQVWLKCLPGNTFVSKQCAKNAERNA